VINKKKEKSHFACMNLSLSEQPSASRDGKHRSSGFNPKWLADPKFSRWHILGLYTIAQVLRWQQAKAKVNN